MPSWGEVLEELQQTAALNGGRVDFDNVRRKYLTQLQERTGRSTIIYYSAWPGGASPGIGLEDMQGLMETCRNLPGPNLDIVLNSPGGSAEATASMVRYLRSKYSDIRVFVPLAAMSAATMWSLAADRIVMGKHSQLGPIDPQLMTAQGATPTSAIIRQFKRAQDECAADPTKLGAWMPILQQYGLGLLELCADAEELAKRLVGEWLTTYMFAGQDDAKAKADVAASFFSDYDTHRSHALGIGRDEAREKASLVIEDLEDDAELQDAVLSVHHAAMHTVAGPCEKLIENHLGKGIFRMPQQIQIGPMQMLGPPGNIPVAMPPPIV